MAKREGKHYVGGYVKESLVTDLDSILAIVKSSKPRNGVGFTRSHLVEEILEAYVQKFNKDHHCHEREELEVVNAHLKEVMNRRAELLKKIMGSL